MYSILYAIGSFQSLVFTILLLIKKDKKKADNFLASFFFLMSIYFFNVFSHVFEFWKEVPNLYLSISFVSLILGPLIYFYIYTLIGNKLKKRHLAHILPIIIIHLMILPFLFDSDIEKNLFFTDKFTVLPYYVSTTLFVQYLSAPIYFASKPSTASGHDSYAISNKPTCLVHYITQRVHFGLSRTLPIHIKPPPRP